jgi:phage regulator Rha-like protein
MRTATYMNSNTISMTEIAAVIAGSSNEPRQLVTISNGQPTTDTITIAHGTENSHEAVIKLVRAYDTDLRDFGPLRFEIRKGKALRQGGFGKATEYAVLNEPQTTLLLAYMKNTPVVRDFKKRLVREFYRMAQELRDKRTPERMQARQQAKIVRRGETDTIAEFVTYAVAQGSKNAQRYYSNITTMTYQGLGFIAQVQHPVRDFMTAAQTAALTLGEVAVTEALKEGMAAGLPYKAIYQFAKERVLSLSAALPLQLKLAA